MADARLQWRQLNQAQPNVSGLMAQVRGGINDAAGAADRILGRYQEGQELAGDQELARLLSSATTQEELSALANSDAVRGLRLSENGIGMLNDAQQGIATFQNTHSQIRDRDGRLGIAQDANSRQATRFGWDQADRADAMARRDFLRENSALAGDAAAFTREHGDVVGPITQQGSAFENYLAATIQSESGGDPNARNPNSSATGLGQFTDGTWREMMARHPDLGLTADGRTDPRQAEAALRRFTQDNMRFLESAGIEITEGNLYAAHFLGRGGAREVLGRADNERLVDILPSNVISANPFLENMTVGRFRQWSAEKGGAGQNLAGSTTPTPMMEYRERLNESGLFNASEIDQFFDPINTNAETRSDELAARDAELLAETVATANQNILSNPEIVTVEQVRDAVFSDERFTARENEARYEMIQDLIGEDPGRLRPSVSDGALAGTDAIIETTIAAAERANESNPRFAFLADAETLAATDTTTVGQNVANRLGLGTDGENPGGLGGVLGFEAGFDVNQLDIMIEDAARRNNVTPEIAAAAMIRAFERDPFGRNTLANRFDKDTVDAAIDEIDQGDQRSFDERRANVEIMRQEMASVRSQEQLLLAQIQQTPIGPQREALQTQLQAVRAELGRIEQRLSNAPAREDS